MKKNAVIFLALAVFCTQVFAAEFIITPKFGLSNTSISQKVEGVESYGDKKPDKLNWLSAVAGLGLGVVTDHNIMILFNTDFAFAGSIKAKTGYDKDASKYGNEYKLKGGLYFWQPSLILGYSFKPNDALSCNFGAGIAFMIASTPMAKESEYTPKVGTGATAKKGTLVIVGDPYSGFSIHFPIHFDIQYYFTDHIGIIAELQDVIGRGYISNGYDPIDPAKFTINGVCNNFSFKVGPAFKF
ncbi:MAG: DUF2715 domain-containing protein [Treponemataceae bacterium]